MNTVALGYITQPEHESNRIFIHAQYAILCKGLHMAALVAVSLLQISPVLSQLLVHTLPQVKRCLAQLLRRDQVS